MATIAVFVVTQQYAAAAKTASAAFAYVVAGGAVAGLINTGTLRGTVMGAVDAALTFGIGQNIKNPYALIAAHSLKGGMLEAFNGGDFGHGFITAGLSKFVGMGVDKLTVGDPMKIVIEALAGGTVSAATGGDFANGAVSAALQFAFNQLMGGKFHEGKPVVNEQCDGCTLVPNKIDGKIISWGWIGQADAVDHHLAQESGAESLNDYRLSENIGKGKAAGQISMRAGLGVGFRIDFTTQLDGHGNFTTSQFLGVGLITGFDISSTGQAGLGGGEGFTVKASAGLPKWLGGSTPIGKNLRWSCSVYENYSDGTHGKIMVGADYRLFRSLTWVTPNIFVGKTW